MRTTLQPGQGATDTFRSLVGHLHHSFRGDSWSPNWETVECVAAVESRGGNVPIFIAVEVVLVHVAAWKAHKTTCVPIDKEPKSLPQTWAQVESHGGSRVEGKTLEVRAILDESMTRQIFQCKDRVGVVKRIAAYTSDRRIPGLLAFITSWMVAVEPGLKRRIYQI
eukprot:scaffold9624_cov79-Skeletonema_dohrnii-CCMP3373.AAC.1